MYLQGNLQLHVRLATQRKSLRKLNFSSIISGCVSREMEYPNLAQFTVACERRRISGCRWFRGDNRQPEIRLRSQAKFTAHVGKNL